MKDIKDDFYCINPYIFISINSVSIPPFILHNFESKTSYKVSESVLKIFGYCCAPQKLSSLKKYMEEELHCSSSEAKKTFHFLIEKHILVTQAIYTEKIKDSEDFSKYNWLQAFYFLLDSENINVDDKHSNKKRGEIVKAYLKISKPSFYKEYVGAKVIPLTTPNNITETSLEEVLLQRRTYRSFSQPIDKVELSEILYLGCDEARNLRNKQLLSYQRNPKVLLNSAFSPFELYVATSGINGIQNGIYHYNMKRHYLEQIKVGSFSHALALMAHGEMFLEKASVIILITAIFDRYMFRYRYSRAYKELLMTAAQLAHFIILQATKLNIKTFETPALLDTELSHFLEIDGWKEDSLYLLGLGK